jgi:hypothetical protein
MPRLPHVSRVLPLTFRLMLAAMLAVIGLHAVPDQPLPAQVSHGSAFSAGTVEVSLLARRVATGEAKPVAAPVPLPRIPVAEPVAIVSDAHPRTTWPAHPQTGPPALRLGRGDPPPRAPPALS